MTQDDLFSAPPSHRADPITSRIAAGRAAPNAGAHRERILRHLLRVGSHGATAWEAYKATGGRQPAAAGTRLLELSRPKTGPALTEMTGRTRPTDTGSPAFVWVLTHAGVDYAKGLARAAA